MKLQAATAFVTTRWAPGAHSNMEVCIANLLMKLNNIIKSAMLIKKYLVCNANLLVKKLKVCIANSLIKTI